MLDAPAGWAGMTPAELAKAASATSRHGLSQREVEVAAVKPAAGGAGGYTNTSPGTQGGANSVAPSNPAIAALEKAAASAAMAAADAAVRQDWDAMGKASAAA